MYKAIKEIGGYAVGEEVPTEKAETWLKMYSVPHVKKVGKGTKSTEETMVETTKEESFEEMPEEPSDDAMLDDYLARGKFVVKKAIVNDNLSKEKLEKLLKLEAHGKDRKIIVDAIKQKLDE